MYEKRQNKTVLESIKRSCYGSREQNEKNDVGHIEIGRKQYGKLVKQFLKYRKRKCKLKRVFFELLEGQQRETSLYSQLKTITTPTSGLYNVVFNELIVYVYFMFCDTVLINKCCD